MKGVIDSLTHLHSGKAFDIFRQKLQHFVNKNNIILSLPTNEESKEKRERCEPVNKT